jgi:UDP-N-acetylglucosamine 4-epimerase
MSEPADARSPWLVTGAAGFIGSNLCLSLLDQGVPVIGLDNFVSGKRENIERLKGHKSARFRLIEGDIRDAGIISQAVDGCATVAHLAALVSVPKSFEHVGETNSINIDGFTTVFKAAREGGTKRFVYASSSAIYGDTTLLPTPETVPAAPLSPYAISKLTNEYYAAVLAESGSQIQAVGLRFFNVYGPWQDHQGGYAAVIPRWIEAIIEDRTPIIFGDGSASRDFCHVDDICRVIYHLGDPENPFNYPLYNIGNGNPVPLGELLGTIERELSRLGISKKITPETQPWRAGDIIHSLADVSRAVDDIDFRPQIDLATGIASILQRQYHIGI